MLGNFGFFVVLARNCLASMFYYIVVQIRKTNREKSYSEEKEKSSDFSSESKKTLPASLKSYLRSQPRSQGLSSYRPIGLLGTVR